MSGCRVVVIAAAAADADDAKRSAVTLNLGLVLVNVSTTSRKPCAAAAAAENHIQILVTTSALLSAVDRGEGQQAPQAETQVLRDGVNESAYSSATTRLSCGRRRRRDPIGSTSSSSRYCNCSTRT